MARLLDLTRTVSRLGRGPLTGIDRVEVAWARHLLGQPDPLWSLVRTRWGFLLLDRMGVAGLLAHVDGVPLPPADALGRLSWRDQPHRARAEAVARRSAVARAPVWGLDRLLKRLPHSGCYLNLGHMNLTPRVFSALRGCGWQSVVLVHDAIPLDHPTLARAGTVPVFARKLAAVSAGADRVICTTEDARARVATHLARAGRVPPMAVAPLGVDLAAAGALPPGFDAETPFFLCLGTIEPRKNHAILLDVWARLADPPRLVIVGARGWAEPELLARLDARPQAIEEWPGLTDAQVAALMARAQALLFPSLAEGFGLPLMEAAARGLPVIASDLAVFRELAGDYPVYLAPTDVYAWQETIQGRTRAGQQGQGSAVPARVGIAIPTWADHFNAVLTTVC